MKAFDDHRGAGVEMTREEFGRLYTLALAALQNFERLDATIAEMNEEQASQLIDRMSDVIKSY